MYNSLILYRNELKNRIIPKYKLIGIITELIYSKDIFAKNKDISNFVKDIFDIELKDYVVKSRTMIVAKISKKIIGSESIIDYKNKLYNFISIQIETLKKNSDIKENKNELDGWIK
ncbi:hypothetical protein [Romboutsia timonensis]|uniref:hypothetical protein n=1 Tax=Romboutsia timonensis TaxID=1776391 RepID=UPI002A80BBEA|nr:hypothetical protein [Romboutsia timonensis]MDY3958913.1 hypothetical protein [Romboutsia timonensis]